MCIPGNGYDDFKVLGEETLVINLSYKTLNRNYSERFEIPLDGYNYMVNQSDYARLTKKKINEIKNTNKELKNITNSLKNMKNK